jgi:uncharacterized protein YbaR (Trm112 family)
MPTACETQNRWAGAKAPRHAEGEMSHMTLLRCPRCQRALACVQQGRLLLGGVWVRPLQGAWLYCPVDACGGAVRFGARRPAVAC